MRTRDFVSRGGDDEAPPEDDDSDLEIPDDARKRLAERANKYYPTDKPRGRSQFYRPYYLIRKERDFTVAKKEIFIFTLADTGTVPQAAEAAGISVGTALNHRNSNHTMYDPDFDDAWKEAAAEYNASVEQEIHARAITGWEEPVFGGKDRDVVVGHVTKKSDRLLQVLAKRRMPAEYGDKVEVKRVGGGEASTEIAPGVGVADLTADQRKKLKAFLTSVDGVDRSEVIDVEPDALPALTTGAKRDTDTEE